MLKSIQIKLNKVKYIGDSICDGWMEIYNALVKARKGDFMSIGILEVVD